MDVGALVVILVDNAAVTPSRPSSFPPPFILLLLPPLSTLSSCPLHPVLLPLAPYPYRSFLILSTYPPEYFFLVLVVEGGRAHIPDRNEYFRWTGGFFGLMDGQRYYRIVCRSYLPFYLLSFLYCFFVSLLGTR